MENNLKTLEQIQEEFKIKISELITEQKVEEIIEEKGEEITEQKVEEIIEEKSEEITEENIEQNNEETVLEKIRIDDIVENLDVESEEENLIIDDKEISLDVPQIFLGGKELFEEEDDQLSEMIEPFEIKNKGKVVRIITTIIIILCIVGIVLGAMVFLVGRDPEKEYFGYGFYPEYTETMSPKYNRGDMVLYEAKGVEEIVAETTVGSYIVAYTNNQRKTLCVVQVEDIIRDNKTGDVYYQIRADKEILEDEKIIQAHLVKGKAKFYPLKWFAFGTYYVIKYVKYFAIGFFAPLVFAIVVRAIFGRKRKLQFEDDFDEEDFNLDEE